MVRSKLTRMSLYMVVCYQLVHNPMKDIVICQDGPSPLIVVTVRFVGAFSLSVIGLVRSHALVPSSTYGGLVFPIS